MGEVIRPKWAVGDGGRRVPGEAAPVLYYVLVKLLKELESADIRTPFNGDEFEAAMSDAHIAVLGIDDQSVKLSAQLLDFAGATFSALTGDEPDPVSWPLAELSRALNARAVKTPKLTAMAAALSRAVDLISVRA